MKGRETEKTDAAGLSVEYLILLVVAVAGAVLIAALVLNHYPLAPSASTPDTAIPGYTIRIAGSTTVQPVSEILAGMFMKIDPKAKLLVEGGGSGSGIRQGGEGTVEIGAASRPLEAGERARYPDLRVHQIGGSAVVLIASRDYPADRVTADEVRALFDNRSTDLSALPGVGHVQAAVQRIDPSGTEEIFAQWLFGSSTPSVDAALGAEDRGAAGTVEALAAPSNAAVLDLVKQSSNAIGFVDVGYAEGDPGVKILRIVDTGQSQALPRNTSAIRAAILDELAHPDGRNGAYIERLTRPLAYVTSGEPSPPVARFIAFARSDEAAFAFDEIGYFSMAEIRAASGQPGAPTEQEIGQSPAEGHP